MKDTNGHPPLTLVAPNPLDAACCRCGVSILWMIPRVAKLAGEYRAALCVECINDWEVYAREHPLIREADRLLIKENQISQKIVRDDIERCTELLEIRDLIVANKKELFALAESFCSFPADRGTASRSRRSPEELRNFFAAQRERLMMGLTALSKAEEAAARAGGAAS